MGTLPQRAIEILHRQARNRVLTLILPGFNQDGAALLQVLAAGLAHSDTLTYRLPRWGFDQQMLVAGLTAVQRHPKVVVYAESAGALDLAAALRAYPEFRITRLILNAGMGSWEDANAATLIRLSRHIPGVVMPTPLLRVMQRKAVANSPRLDDGVDHRAARQAQHNSLNITGPQVVGEFRRMATTPPIRPGEFRGRIDGLTYLGAPDRSGQRLAENGPLVRLRQAHARWLEAAGTRTSRVITPRTWAGLHTPTPEKSGPVIKALTVAIREVAQS